MVYKKILFYLGLFVLVNVLNAQENDSTTKTTRRFPVLQLDEPLQNENYYTGIDGRFVLSFANDSIVQARFFKFDRIRRYQKIHYRTNGDTVFLHNYSQTRIPYSRCSSEDVKIITPGKGIPVVVKFFYSIQPDTIKRVRERKLLDEIVYYMDSISQQLYIPYNSVACLYSNIIVLSCENYYARLYKEIDTSYEGMISNDYLKIDFSNRGYMSLEALFNEFPLVMKGDSIFPVDSEKNHQCWIDNGFFFPIMVKGRGEPWKAEDIFYNTTGLEGIKYEL